MRLNLTALCLLLLNLQCRALADVAKKSLDEGSKQVSKASMDVHTGPNVQTNSEDNSEDEKSDEGEDEDENDDDDDNEDKTDGDGDGEGDATKVKQTTAKVDENADMELESNAVNPSEDNESDVIVSKPKLNVVKAVKSAEVLDETDQKSETNDKSDSTHAFIDTSKEVTAQLYNAISGIATTNITMDAWKNQTWANKTPREVVDMIEHEFKIMLHDKYVHFIVFTMGILSILFTLYVVQQVIEHPSGSLSKFCRCTIACLRILCCPIYTILCCPCCTNKKNRPNTKEYSHLPLHDVNDASKKN